MKQNPFINTRIEFHILQSFPVTCLNRDDVGAPKTAFIGGTMRARVSSQCWKRRVRMEMNKLGVTCGIRSKLISKLISESCIQEGAVLEQALSCGDAIESIFIKKQEKGKSKKKAEAEVELENIEEQQNNDTLIFFSPNEIQRLVKTFKEVAFSPDKLFEGDQKKQLKKLKEILDGDIEPINAVDVALFGRMVAKAPNMNIEAAASFSHAISTHKISNEVEFFSALDDKADKQGAGHLGSLEFNSATYYRYISLDLGQLWETLKGINFIPAIEGFIKALFIALPAARQATMSGASQWDYAKILLRSGQRLQIPFETAIKVQDGGFLHSSIKHLKEELQKKEARAGSLFGKKKEYTFGESDFSIDDLVAELRKFLEGKVE